MNPDEQQLAQSTQQPAPQAASQQYLTTNQYKQAVQQAAVQGINPDQFLKTITSNGVIVQGYNDQQYKLGAQTTINQQNQPSSQPQESLLGKIGSFAGGALKSISQPFVTAAGSAVRAIQATPQLFSGNISGAEKTMESPIFGEKTAPAMNNKELLGSAAKAGSFLAPGLGLGAVATGAVGGALFSAGESATENKSGNEIAGAGLIGAIGGAVLGKVYSSVAGKVSGEGGYSSAVNSAEDIINRANAYRGSIPQNLIQGAQDLTQSNPEAIVNIIKTDGMNILTQISGLNDSTINQAISQDLTPSSIQTISSRLNTLASMSGEKSGLQLFGLNNEFRTWATNALNDSSPGVGDALQGLYKSASDQYGVYDDLMRTLDQKPGQALSTTEADSLINSIKQKAATPQGKIVLQRGLQDFADNAGIDLSKPASIAQYQAKLAPAAKTIFKFILQGAGFGTVYTATTEIGKHFGL